MTQALYAHMNNNKERKKERNTMLLNPFIIGPISYYPACSRERISVNLNSLSYSNFNYLKNRIPAYILVSMFIL
jgi:hypothetical protein